MTTAREEAKFEKAAEQHFKSHPTLLPGRDFRMQTFRHELKSGQQRIRENWDNIAWDSKQLAPTEVELGNIKCLGWHEVNRNTPEGFRKAIEPKCSECEHRGICEHEDHI